MNYIKNIGEKSLKAFESLKNVEHSKIKRVLKEYATLVKKNKLKILRENSKDIKKAQRKKLIDRLILNSAKINQIISSVKAIEKFKDTIGQVLSKWKRSNKLQIEKVSIPIGVICVIYESRPNVTADVAALCLKSGNSVILRGGSEAYYTNRFLANLFRRALKKNKIDKNCVQFIEKKDRKIVDFILSKMRNYINLIVKFECTNL